VFALKSGEDLSGVPWYPKELCVLGELSSSTTVAAMMEATGIDERDLRLILGVFDRLGIIEQIGDAPMARAENNAGPTALIKKTHFPFERLVPLVTNAVLTEKLEVLNNPSSFISEQFKTL